MMTRKMKKTFSNIEYSIDSSGVYNFTLKNGIKRILAVGDVHGFWASLARIISIKKPDLVIQVGDFGYFPRFSRLENNGPENIDLNGANIIFCGGNHEDWESLNNIEKTGNLYISPGIFYASRCSKLTLPSGRKILFMGGASSIDRQFRTEGVDWFRDEIIPESVYYKLTDEKIDIIVAHTVPECHIPITNPIIEKDPSRNILLDLIKKYRPKEYFYGHWHIRNDYYFVDTETNLICLKDIPFHGFTEDSCFWMEE